MCVYNQNMTSLNNSSTTLNFKIFTESTPRVCKFKVSSEYQCGNSASFQLPQSRCADTQTAHNLFYCSFAFVLCSCIYQAKTLRFLTKTFVISWQVCGSRSVWTRVNRLCRHRCQGSCLWPDLLSCGFDALSLNPR